jgi:hypothetical protein
MFEHWNLLNNIGKSRKVAFYVDGVGNFQPKCKCEFDREIPNLTEKIKRNISYFELQ